MPAGDYDLAQLAAAVHQHHPDWIINAVWCGDPHLRPALHGALRDAWCDLDLVEPTGAGWGRLLVALPTRAYEWCRVAAALSRMLDTSDAPAVALRVGSVAILGDCSALFGDTAVTFIERTVGSLPNDGLAPAEADVVAHGRYCTVVAAFAPGAQPALAWLGTQLVQATGEVGPWLDRLVDVFDVGVCADASIGAGPWRALSELPPALIDLDLLDHNQTWYFTFGDAPSRVRLSHDALLATAVPAALPQISGREMPIRLPGGLTVDEPMRTLMRAALQAWRVNADAVPPEPFGPDNSAFLTWLETPFDAGADVGRYWMAVRDSRPDLQAAFPQPNSFDAARLTEWADASWYLEARSMLLRPTVGVSHRITSVGAEPGGVNVLGYLDFDQSLGQIAREIVSALEAAHTPVAPINHHRSGCARRPDPIELPREARYATNIVIVNADQFEFVVADHGATLLDGRYTIAYWFWELEFVPLAMRKAIDHVDEIWVGSQFVADAFSRVTDKPVRLVPLPIGQPEPSARDRASFGLDDDRFVFLATFDYGSVPERKNPFGVIDAFTRAFADGEGPLLWIKTLNGDKGWQQHERLLLAASGRSDIIVWDEHLSRPDQMAVLKAADCLVSLHRSEGLGLHCAEAMWLGKPVIATRYSGNLDFMDDSCSALIDYELVPVRYGQGIYPPEATWAEPNTEQAAFWMRRLENDAALCAKLGTKARERMAAQPSLDETGRTIARLAGLHMTKGDS